MPAKAPDYTALLVNALDRVREGVDPALIELPERSVFPHLIPVQPTTASKARTSGLLLGRPAPPFIKRGRSVRYRLKDIWDWLADARLYGSTADVVAATTGAARAQETSTPEAEAEGFLS